MEDPARRICQTVKGYIMSEFLRGEDPKTLGDDTPLITGGVLDSIQITKLVIFLEETYDLEFQVQEIAADRIDTLESITRTVQKKITERA